MFLLIALLLSAGAPGIYDHQSSSNSNNRSIRVDSLGITADQNTKWYSYTNKESGFYFGEVRGPNTAPYQGWTVYNDPVLKDYSIAVGSKELNRDDSRVIVFPDRLVRHYNSGIIETFTLLDEVNAFVVNIQAPEVSDIDFRLLFNSTSDKAFALTGEVPAFVLENKSVPYDNYGRWVGVGTNLVIQKIENKMVGEFLSPAVFSVHGKSATFVVTCGRTRLDASRDAFGILRIYHDLGIARKERMQTLLDTSFVSTGNEKFDKALAWAKLSLNALVTDQGMKGIWAGLPWFNNYWGRDTFISLAGATRSP